MNSIMVVIEGLDITGKTTIAKALAERDHWRYYRTPPPPYYEACVKSGVDGRPVFNEERFLLFLECLKYSSREIAELLKSGISVVVDRWLWTTLSYHFAFNPDLEARWREYKNEYEPDLTSPELSILMHVADKEVYAQRKASRGKLTELDKVVLNDEIKSSAIWHNFNRLNPKFLLVDNSGSFESTMKIVLKHVEAVKIQN